MHVPAWPGLCPADLLRSEIARELPFPFSATNGTYFYRARNALYHLFRALALQRDETVLVPDYHSGNEVWAIRAAGASIRYYRINRQLEPDLDQLERLCKAGARALLAIHYFGSPQPVKELARLCREHGLLLIEDCALSLLSEADGQPLGSFGDYATFCLYKTVAIPNGALLVQNRHVVDDLMRLELRSCGTLSVASRCAELMLGWLQNRSDASGQAAFAVKRSLGWALRSLRIKSVPVGDIGFELDAVDVAMAGVSDRLLKQFDYEAIRRQRRNNFNLLTERLAGRGALLGALEDGVCPLFFPLLVPDKHEAAKALWRRGIGAVEFWNYGDAEARGAGFEDAQFLRDHVLELPIHQDVSASQIEYVADQILGLELPSPALEKTAALERHACSRP